MCKPLVLTQANTGANACEYSYILSMRNTTQGNIESTINTRETDEYIGSDVHVVH